MHYTIEIETKPMVLTDNRYDDLKNPVGEINIVGTYKKSIYDFIGEVGDIAHHALMVMSMYRQEHEGNLPRELDDLFLELEADQCTILDFLHD